MKNQISKKTIWKSVLSLFVISLFIYLGLGSNEIFLILGAPGLNVVTEYNEQTGEYTQQFHGATGENFDTIWQQDATFKKNHYGMWHGNSTIVNSNYFRFDKYLKHFRKSTEKVYFRNGERHGVSITELHTYDQYKSDRDIFNEVKTYDTICYNHGYVIPCDKLKNASITAENSTGFQILEKNYPWFLGTLNVLGFTNEYVHSYMDTIEVLLNIESFDITKFNGQYNDVIEILEETTYDSLVLTNTMVTSVFGLELMKDFEFRMAVIDQQREKEKGTFHFLQSRYPYFLTSFDSEDVTVKNSEWEAFCSKFDNVMDTFPLLDISDPFFIDSVDSRIFSTLMFISEEEEDTIKSILKQAISFKENIHLASLLEEHKTNLFLQLTEDILPQAFATAILIRMARNYLYEGDVPLLAIKEAYYLQQNIIQVPTLTTHLAENQSSSSATIEGNIIKDGGAEITDKGIVLATFLNPTTNDSTIKLQPEESFSINIDDLIEGETYYVRSYATNTAGTAYGNNISFMAGSSVGLYQNKLGNSDFNIYPNPTKGNLSIRYFVAEDSKCEIRIYDIQGRQVAQPLSEFRNAGFHQIEFQYNEIPNGIYLIKFANNQESFTIKSILNK